MNKIYSLMIIIAGILWGSMGVFVKTISAFGFSTIQCTALRLVTAALSFVLLCIIADYKILKIHLKDIHMFLLIGLGSIFAMSFIYFESIKYSSVSIAAILLYTAPIMVMIMSAVLFKEKVTLTKFIALLGAFLGIVLISLPGKNFHLNAKGLILGLGSAFCYALYSIIGKFILKKYHPLTMTAYAFIFAAIGAISICGVSDTINIFIYSGKRINELFLWSIGMGLITAVLPYTLYTIGLNHIKAGKASVMASVEPMTATLIGILAYSEIPSIFGAIGIVLILVSVTFVALTK